MNYANEIRNNTVLGRAGERDGGVLFWYGSAPSPGVTLTHNVQVHRNRIEDAFAQNGPNLIGGGISTLQGWYVASPEPIGPSRLMVYRNHLHATGPQTGVFFDKPYVTRNVVLDNVISGVPNLAVDHGTENLIGP